MLLSIHGTPDGVVFAVCSFSKDEPEATFPPTVAGAVDCRNYLQKHGGGNVQMSSDLFHPDEFPEFAPFAIDIACGEFEKALAAGVIEVDLGGVSPEPAAVSTKESALAVLGRVAALPALAALQADFLINAKHAPFDGVRFYTDQRCADFYLDDTDGPGQESWMLQGTNADGEIDFIVGGLDPAQTEFTVVPMVLAYLKSAE